MHLLHRAADRRPQGLQLGAARGLGERFFGRTHAIPGLAQFAHGVGADFGIGRHDLLLQTGDRRVERDDFRARDLEFGTRLDQQLLTLQIGQNRCIAECRSLVANAGALGDQRQGLFDLGGGLLQTPAVRRARCIFSCAEACELTGALGHLRGQLGLRAIDVEG